MTIGSKYWKIRFSAPSCTQSKTGYPSGKYIWAVTLCFSENQDIMLRSVAWKCHLRKQLDNLAIKYEQSLNFISLPPTPLSHATDYGPDLGTSTVRSQSRMSMNLTFAYQWNTQNKAKSSVELRLTSILHFQILSIHQNSTARAVQTKHNQLFSSEFLNTQYLLYYMVGSNCNVL